MQRFTWPNITCAKNNETNSGAGTIRAEQKKQIIFLTSWNHRRAHDQRHKSKCSGELL